MSANKTGLWVVDQRPMQVEQMMFTDEMNRELENLQDNKLKRVTIVGSRGIGKTPVSYTHLTLPTSSRV